MIQSVHVLISVQLRTKSLVTSLTPELGLPVSFVVHMLIRGTLGKELSIACVTFES